MNNGVITAKFQDADNNGKYKLFYELLELAQTVVDEWKNGEGEVSYYAIEKLSEFTESK